MVARTDGVPLFIQEMARMLLDAYLVEQEGVWASRTRRSRPPFRSRCATSLVSRFDRLGSVKGLLQLAATIGRQFDAELLCACSGKSPEAMDKDMAVLLDAARLARPVRRAPSSSATR